jgi:hypothetical protein
MQLNLIAILTLFPNFYCLWPWFCAENNGGRLVEERPP